MAESDGLLEVLKEIRDEIRAVRTELGGHGPRMTTSGIRTEVVDRAARWRNAALAGGGLAVGFATLAIVLGIAMRDRPAPAAVAVAPQVSAIPAVKLGTPAAIPTPLTSAVAPATVVVAAPVAVPTANSAKPLAAPSPAAKQAARSPAGVFAVASVPALTKTRFKPEIAAKPPAEVASDADEAMAFAPPPRRVRVHRMSYGPVESEPAKL